MTSDRWRQLIAATLVVGLCAASFLAVRWVWRDITYWSRSATFAYGTGTLKECVSLAVDDWPGVTASFPGHMITLHTRLQEGVIVKETSMPQVARIVVYGHSASISNLGPSSEEFVSDFLREFSRRVSLRCGGS